MNILLGVTGSVAAIKTKELARELSKIGDVRIVATDSGNYFVKPECRHPAERHQCVYLNEGSPQEQINGPRVPFYRDKDEWPQTPFKESDFKLGDPVLHIELRRWASIFVIAPLSANTISKLHLGICDNLLTSVFRAWDWSKHVLVAPAMNTFMWESELTQGQLSGLHTRHYGKFHIVPPVSKRLACDDVGTGAMAPIDQIVQEVNRKLRWHFPLNWCSGIPINHHPGAWGFHRSKNHHTGVDLYCRDGDPVLAVEDGTVVKVDIFTGPARGHEWWEETYGLMVEGPSGVINYGELAKPHKPVWTENGIESVELKVGMKVKRGEQIGNVKRVLFEHKHRPDIPGHSTSMLHFELYRTGTRDFADWHDPQKNPALLDPTPMLMAAEGAPANTLTWGNEEGKTVG